MKHALYFLLSLLLVSAAACGDKDEKPDENSYKCSADDSVRCDRATEFCLRTYIDDVEQTAECHEIPADCQDGCDCLTDTEVVNETCGSFSLCTEINDTNPRVDCEPPETM